MPDEMDVVQGHNDDFHAFALGFNQRHREPALYTGTDCVDCEKEIPEARRKAQKGCCRCVSYQAEHELLTNWRAL